MRLGLRARAQLFNLLPQLFMVMEPLERLAGLLDLPQRVRAMDADVAQVKAFIAETCA